MVPACWLWWHDSVHRARALASQPRPTASACACGDVCTCPPCEIRCAPCSACADIMYSCRTQSGTTHYLGDNFARAFNTQFLDEKGDQVGARPARKHGGFLPGGVSSTDTLVWDLTELHSSVQHSLFSRWNLYVALPIITVHSARAAGDS